MFYKLFYGFYILIVFFIILFVTYFYYTYRLTRIIKIEDIDEPISCKERRLPDALIIGVAKAGTGALKIFLPLNPQIVADGEFHFFNTKKYEKGLEKYRRMMPYASEDQVGKE